ncbi:pyridoxal phosphate-dependent aminotransferase [Rhodococcus sp. IEGM 1330]|uniref:pyridoxal phosphate-dependent aminotransferase n=1 Tax=Rhodococcus sp. IEGM 1330 TaxID=3082225 RepID=UPI0029545EA5|nr:pyridoxal phosphate-dependent aminotransferase [Rhodococcus sp. IEGM 1330]MDV8022651.1 pyridoxal phosphate-dependent aminotransferase [Rhodococcus sp. IEGM 1330]
MAPSATLAIDAKVKALRAEGKNVISFGVGEPDLPPATHILDAARRSCIDDTNHRYSPAGGKQVLRQAVAERTVRTSGRTTVADEVVITNGGKHAIATAFMTLLDAGDEVIIVAPYWTTYPESVRLAGGVPVIVQTTEATGFLATVEALEEKRSSRTIAIVVVSPGNPTGSVHSALELEEIGNWAVNNRLWVVSDEIYQDFTYENPFVSIAGVCPGLVDRLVLIDGVSKSYSMTGWRVGWLTAPREFAQAAATLISHTTSNVNNVAQDAAIAALTGEQSAVDRMRDAFVSRRERGHQLLGDIDGVVCGKPGGAFYLYPNVKALFGRSIGGRIIDSSVTLAEVALSEALIGLVPGEAFGTPGYLRISYALSKTEMEEGLGRFARLINNS